MPDDGRSTPKNGASRAPIGGLAVAEGAAIYDDDPMSKVLGLDAQASGPIAWLGYYVGAFALLLGMMVTARAVTVILERMDAQAQPAQIASQEIDVMNEPPPPPPPPPTEEPKPEEPPPVAKPAPREPPPPPAPAPAQAAKVLAQEPDPNEPVDLTGNTFVQGNADSYAGGTTSGNGTSTRPVRAIASPTGVPNGTGAPTAAPVVQGPNRSRRASVGGSEWNAPFPPEADTAQIDEAYVTMEIDVRADGTASAVRILKDPGNGFGREARKYALTWHYQTALDPDGNPIPSTFTTRVHFQR